MHISAWKNLLCEGKCDAELHTLYGMSAEPRARYEALCDEYLRTFSDDDGAVLISAPGRTELAGNHTDHQMGLVLCGAVTLDIAAAAAPSGNGVVELLSDGFGRVSVKLDDLTVHDEEIGTTEALIRGTAAAFAEQGLAIGGFRACVSSTVPAGGGISSSAAFEILMGSLFSRFYNNGGTDALLLARIGQKAERDYFGKPSGLLDQTASAVGGIAKIDFADPGNPKVERIPFDFRENGYVLCAVNTHTRHDGLTADYAAIPHDMTAVANALDRTALRYVNPKDFFDSDVQARLSQTLSETALNRAEHFFRENERVECMAEALKHGSMESYLRSMNESGSSSRNLLRNIVPLQHPERTEMAEALDRAAGLLEGKGAWRVHGGGFAGCIQCLVPTADFPAFQKTMDSFYGTGSCFELRIRPCGAYALTGEE